MINCVCPTHPPHSISPATGDAYPDPVAIEVPGSDLLALCTPSPPPKRKGGKDGGHHAEVQWTLWLSKVFLEAALVDLAGWYCLPRRTLVQVSIAVGATLYLFTHLVA